ncbi:hypothetical protein ACP70R_030617 [Stipagrostis hirtigluma subsp. patula]
MEGSVWKKPPLVPARILDAKLREDFLDFLNTYTTGGSNVPAYQPQVRNLGVQGCTTLHIQFDDILDALSQNRKFKDLVLKIGNDPSNSWLSPIVYELLLESPTVQGHVKSGKEVPDYVRKKTCALILHKPNSISELKDFLTDKSKPPTKIVSVLAGRMSVFAATTRGRTGFRIVMCKMLSCFGKDTWFPDGLSIEDVFIINSEVCYIAKNLISLSQLLLAHKPQAARDMMAVGKKENLSSLWTMMNGFFCARDGKLPIYFSALKEDLTSASLDEVTREWFLKYLSIHFALTSSLCRKCFTCESYQVCKTHGLSNKSPFSLLPPFSLIGDIDWRVYVHEKNDYILNNVFWYGLSLVGYDDIAKKLTLGQFDAIDFTVLPHQHPETVGGIMDFKRHLLQHCEEHFRKELALKRRRGDIGETDEIELFASATVPQVEPFLLKKLMEKYSKEFASLLSFYETSTYDKRDLPQQQAF